MTLPTADTTVTYPDGRTTSTGTILHVETLAEGRSAILLDDTAFHPVDTAWPDQPADRGTITTPTGVQPVLDALTGGIKDGHLFLGPDLPVRTGTEGWTFVVAHIVAGEPPQAGEAVSIHVDQEHRAALSRAHTACHLAALALDAALAEAWSKQTPVDSLGNPSFDALAIQQSRIERDRSTDIYRIGKSLRRKGFRTDALENLDLITDGINAQLAQWLRTGGPVRIDRHDEALSARRTWRCDLPEGSTDIPCGGTHVTNLTEIAAITTTLHSEQVEGAVQLTMLTTVKA